MPRPESLTADPMTRRQRVLAVASGGGHWVQLQRLRAAFADSDVTWVTTSDTYRSDVAPAPLMTVPDASRWSKLGLIRLAAHVTWIVIKVRPDVVVTTGAAPGFFACLIGRLTGCRTAWIDSVANVRELSMSGRAAGRWSDLWLTQWKELSGDDGPHYRGAVL